jgi:alpha-glucosidase/alpha-D-xyloside xylohydrolase
VRAGAIVPLDPVRQYTAQPVNEPTTLAVYPGADGTATLYDDDGVSLLYFHDDASWTRLRWNDHARMLTIQPDVRSKLKPFPPRRFEVWFVPGGVRKAVEYSGRRVTVTF